MLGDILLEELALSLCIHRFFLVHEVASLFICLSLFLQFLVHVHGAFDVDDVLLFIQELIGPFEFRDFSHILLGKFNHNSCFGARTGLLNRSRRSHVRQRPASAIAASWLRGDSALLSPANCGGGG